MIDNRELHLRDLHDLLELTGAQHRHRGHHDPADSQHCQPGDYEPGVIGAAQEHTITGLHARIDKHVRSTRHEVVHLAVTPG